MKRIHPTTEADLLDRKGGGDYLTGRGGRYIRVQGVSHNRSRPVRVAQVMGDVARAERRAEAGHVIALMHFRKHLIWYTKRSESF